MKTIYSIILFLFFCISAVFSTVNPPSLRCISVGSLNNSIILNWVPPSDPNSEFVSYDVFVSSTVGGPYSLLTSISNFATLSYTHSPVNLSTGTFYYFVKTKYNDGTGNQQSSSSDTLTPIKVSINSSVQYTPVITWNYPGLGSISTSSSTYIVNKKTTGTPWAFHSSPSVGDEEFTESMFICSDSLYFKVEIADASGCVSRSHQTSKLVSDETAPVPPSIDSVSVDPTTGNILLSWESGPSGDIGGYIVARSISGNWQLDTVWGIQNTFYTDLNNTATSQSQKYGILAFDTCWKGNPLRPNTSPAQGYHETIYLTAEMNLCTLFTELTWTAYQQWSSGVGGYFIYVSVNGGPYQILAQTDAATFNYTHTGMLENTTYCYIVRARESGGTASSSSNKVCQSTLFLNTSKEHFISTVSVNDKHKILVTFRVDPGADLTKYLIKRSRSDDSTRFEIIGEVEQSTDSTLTFQDTKLKPYEFSYFYKVVGVNTCEKEAIVSNVSKSISLLAEVDDAQTRVDLSWNKYRGWDTLGVEVDYYKVFKYFDGESPSGMPLSVIDADDDLSLTDYLTEEYEENGAYCYLVRAFPNRAVSDLIKDSVNSNQACFKIEPRIYIPNAFTPDGNKLNNVFKPVFGFTDKQEYSFTVFDRWGRVIFQTTNPDDGWDGANAQSGTYIYQLKLLSQYGDYYNKAGTVQLVR